MTPESTVLLARDGAIATITLNRPQTHNALDVPMVRAFREICEALEGDGGVRAVILRGAGRNFSVGGDLAAMRPDPGTIAPQLIEALHAGILILAAMDAPVIASLQGAVAGGSLSLAMACDLAIASDRARFNLAYARIGASSDGSSSWHLPRLVGLRRALEIALLSEDIDAAEALRIGLVNRVVPDADLARETQALAERLAAGPTKAYGRLKRLMRRSFDSDLPSQLDAEAEAFRDSTQTHDFVEGVEAFFSKRAAKFEGR